ncbi:MAG: T9SS type A sorting domain-containing protein [Candidatus Eisenbacteria bacterium]|nr:T9SS type A sorting domain-containing protein [Candidatus Eisenbacteria bacterium]
MKSLLAPLVLVFWIGSSVAGPNAGGVLVVHHDPELVYTAGVCDSLVVPSDCTELNPTAAADGSPQLWFVLAAFPDSLANRFSTVVFGLGDYDDTDLVIGAAGPCATFGTPLEIPSPGWPGPNSGTAVSWAPACGSGGLVPVYWFVTYAYAQGSIPLGDYYPNQSSAFVSCGSLPEEDTVSAFATMGFGTPGENQCPIAEGQGDDFDWPEDDDPDWPEDGGSDSPEAPLAECGAPSTDTAPFALIDIYSDQLFSAGCVDSFLPGSFYPSELDDPELLVLRDHVDTVGVFNSYANDGIRILHAAECPETYLEYEVDPPRRATGLLMLATGSLPFPDNIGRALATVRVTYDDGSITEDSLTVGGHLREWHKTHPQAPPDCDVFVLDPPTDDLAGEVWGGFGYSPPDTGWYDVQELLLPSNGLEKRVTRIRITAEMNGVWCDSAGGELEEVFVESGTIVHGISLATQFRVRNGDDTVVTQTQTDSTWATIPYGGYTFQDNVVGESRSIAALGCLLTCYSMLSNYYGVPCNPEDLNEFLQDNRGYARQPACKVVDVQGQAVQDTIILVPASNWRYRSDDEIVLEDDDYTPKATVRIAGQGAGETIVGVIGERQDTTAVIATGDIGFSYQLVDPSIAARYGMSGGQRLYTISRSGRDPKDIERELGRMHPTVVWTRVTSSCRGRHFVVADGMKPHLQPGSTHRGTYSIHDTYYSADELLDAPHFNEFAGARLATPTGQPLDDGGGVLTMNLSGDAVFRIVDPFGRTVRWDGEQNEYQTDIPRTLAIREENVTEPTDSLSMFVTEFIETEGAVGGNYLVEIQGLGTDTFYAGFTGIDTEGTVNSIAETGSVSDGTSVYFLLNYNPEPGTDLTITELNPAAVDPVGPTLDAAMGLRTTPNPSYDQVVISFALQDAGIVMLDVFDVTGARVARLLRSSMEPGARSVPWRCTNDQGERLSSGVYWLRLAGPRGSATRKVVVLR